MGTTDIPGCGHAAAARGELVNDAERTLRAIGARTREDAADYLRMIVHHKELSSAERRVLLDRFDGIECDRLLAEAEQVINADKRTNHQT